MELNDFASIATIIIALFSVLGFMVSFIFSRITLLELKKDRRLSNKPHLVFERGGYGVDIEYKQIKDESNTRIYPYRGNIPGKVLTYHIGQLRNYGTGSAFEIEVKWKGEKVQIDDEWVAIDSLPDEEQKLYSFESNKFVTKHGNLGLNESSGILHFPWFITMDFKRKIQRVDGRLLVKYKNAFNDILYTIQEIRVFTHYEKKHITLTFGDLIKMPENSKYDMEK